MDRTPPFDAESEESVLGQMILDVRFTEDVIEVLDADDFYMSDHRRLFTHLMECYATGEVADLITLGQTFKGDERLTPLRLRDMTATETTPQSARRHARIVADLAAKRRLIGVGASIVDLGYDSQDASLALGAAEGALYAIADRDHRSERVGFSTSVLNALDRVESYVQKGMSFGVPTGYPNVDDLLGGLEPGKLYMLAARPSVGKSAWAANIAANIAREGRRVVFFTLEMSHDELTLRLLCAEAGLSFSSIRRNGEAHAATMFTKLTNTAEEIAAWPITYVDRATITVPEMLSHARRVAREGLSLIVVDYVQLITGHGDFSGRTEEVTLISRALKLMARELNVPVLALAQLNRNVEARKGKPNLSDLRDSGALEQDADVVMFLHRDPSKEEGMYGIDIDLIVAKNRTGPTGDLTLNWRPDLTTFYAPASNVHVLKGL